MDGITPRGRVVVIAATNRPDSIDPALRRPGRLDREIEIGVPDAAGRLEILNIHTRGMPIEDRGCLEGIAAAAHGFTGADLEALAREAAMGALRRILPEIDPGEGRIPAEALKRVGVGKADLEAALREASPSALREVLGESEKGVREVFRKARQAAPCVVLFDEIDAIAPVRGSDAGSRVTDSVVSQLLTEIDGLAGLHGVLVMGATNRPDMIDAALLRPGRFDRIVEVPMPDAAARRQILEIHTRNKPLEAGVDLAALAGEADGMSGAELAEAANAAALAALRRQLRDAPDRPREVKVTREDLAAAIKSAAARTGRRAGSGARDGGAAQPAGH